MLPGWFPTLKPPLTVGREKHRDAGPSVPLSASPPGPEFLAQGGLAAAPSQLHLLIMGFRGTGELTLGHCERYSFTTQIHLVVAFW